MAKLVIIDYGSGNLRSAAKACERAIKDFDINASVEVSNDPLALKDASHVLLPGVGAFGDCMQGLTALPGMLEALEEQVLKEKKWFLGICVGMQLLFERGYEHGVHDGLGWLKGEVKLIERPQEYKIPHMGWNILLPPAKSTDFANYPLLAGIKPGDFTYFVHSYHAVDVRTDHVLATTDYGGEIVAAVGKENIFGTQFHPEKSQATGLQLLANFLRL